MSQQLTKTREKSFGNQGALLTRQPASQETHEPLLNKAVPSPGKSWRQKHWIDSIVYVAAFNDLEVLDIRNLRRL